MKIKRTWIVSTVVRALIVFSAVLLSTSLAIAGTADNPTKLSPKKLSGLLDRPAQEVFYGGIMIGAGETLAGPIVVINGVLDIQDGGALEGDAWVVNGRLILTGSARVNGRVDLVNGNDYLSRQAVVTGGLFYYTCECRLDDEKFEQEGRLAFIKDEDPRAIKTKLSFGMGQANRVNYNVVEAGLKRQNPRHKKPHVRGHALLYFPFRNNTRGYLGFDVDFAVPLKGHQTDLLVRGFKKTYTTDYWQLSEAENSWLLDLAGEDYPDYYERQGGELGVRIGLHRQISLEGAVSFQRELSLECKSSPSLFYPNRELRSNPPIDEGERLAATATFTFDSRADSNYPGNAWQFIGRLEKGIADGPGDFSYTTLTADLRRYTVLPLGLRLANRARVFCAYDALPRQVTQSLNGYGGIRGLDDVPFDVLRGDRLALVSAEVRTGLPELPVFRWLFTRWDFLVFTDIGILARAENNKAPFAFLDTPFNNWKKTAGIGISGESFLPYVGIYLARDLDRDRRTPRVIVRVRQSF
jgi:hypothetical protein